jgi:hypothetical protein
MNDNGISKCFTAGFGTSIFTAMLASVSVPHSSNS